MDRIIIDTATELVKCFKRENYLFFPEYRKNRQSDFKELYRISEQESKILLAHEFLKRGIRFAVEVPTKSTHIQTGKTPLSGRFDLVTYKNQSYEFDWVIEAKSKNPKEEHFRKDFEKMVLSDSNCIWFHTLKNSDSGTFTSILGKINRGIKKEINKFKGQHTWKIAFVVLEKSKLYKLDILMENNKFKELKSIDEFEEIEL